MTGTLHEDQFIFLIISQSLLYTKYTFSVKHNNSLHKMFLLQHVSTLLSHHQAFQRTDPMYQNL